MSTSTALERVAHHLVSTEHPIRETEGMDSERCAALHNAILEHGWLASERTLEAFRSASQTWYERCPPEADENARLHPSLQAFLREARVLPLNHDVHFFYNVRDLSYLGGFTWYLNEGFGFGPSRLMTLYGTYEAFSSKYDGLVYDQETHKAIMHFDMADTLELEPEMPWQKLESILTVWIEMIQRGKAVALPDDVGRVRWEPNGDSTFRLAESPESDPLTGANRVNGQDELDPWTMMPYTPKDLADCLEVWEMAIKEIEQKMVLTEDLTERATGLVETDTLVARGLRPDDFVYRFLSQAQKPRFEYIAPGLRIPTTESFVSQRLMDVCEQNRWDDGDIPPILLFRCEGSVSTDEISFGPPYSGRYALVPTCPCGLYLDRCFRQSTTPFEDGCRLVLPYELGGRALRSDRSLAHGYDQLLQGGTNPFNEQHPVQLQAFLERVYFNVLRGVWAVDAQGVAGGVEIWKDAEIPEKSGHYYVSLGPGEFW